MKRVEEMRTKRLKRQEEMKLKKLKRQEEMRRRHLEKKERKNEQNEREMMAIEDTLSRRAGFADEPLCMYKPKPRVKKLYYGASLRDNKFIDFSSSREMMYEAVYFSTRECVRIGASLDEDDENDELVEAITIRMLIMNSMYRNSKRENQQSIIKHQTTIAHATKK